MQKIPRDEQYQFLKLTGMMGETPTRCREPRSVIHRAQARCRADVAAGCSAGPFFLLAPMNSQRQ